MPTSTSNHPGRRRPPDLPETVRKRLIERVLEEGFDQAGIAAPPDDWQPAAHLQEYIAKGHHGTMDWLGARAGQRAHPTRLWPEARTALVVTQNYAPDHAPMDNLQHKSRGNISVYARGADYHDVLKSKLRSIARWASETFACEVKLFVDTAPIMEKPLAQWAGLGWQGKHTNLVTRALGSWTFLGVLLTDLELPPDAPETDHCGSCRQCLDVCPTNAFPAPYRIDARRCLSYLTIEHKGPIPHEFRTALGNRIYGCDDCLSVCPWNKFAAEARDTKLMARPELEAPDLGKLAGLDDRDFRMLFKGSPIKRTGRDRFVRNVLIAVGNSGDEALAPAAEQRLDDASPLVRGAAVWALRQLLAGARFEALERTHRPKERDAQVLAEWRG